MSYLCEMRILTILPLLAGLALGLASCASDADTEKKQLNPNGDSELALLMRDMFDEGLAAKQALLDGKVPDIRCDVSRLHTASATEPEKVARPEYAVFARSYEDAVAALEAAPFGNRDEAYDHMVNTCVQCHEQLCPGPIRKINKLYLSEREKASLP